MCNMQIAAVVCVLLHSKVKSLSMQPGLQGHYIIGCWLDTIAAVHVCTPVKYLSVMVLIAECDGQHWLNSHAVLSDHYHCLSGQSLASFKGYQLSALTYQCHLTISPINQAYRHCQVNPADCPLHHLFTAAPHGRVLQHKHLHSI